MKRFGRYAYRELAGENIVISFKTKKDCENWLKDEGYRNHFGQTTLKRMITKFGPIVNTIEPVHAMWVFNHNFGTVTYYEDE